MGPNLTHPSEVSETGDAPIRMQVRVWFAVMLRDMRTRFFGNALGYIVLIGWPICHMGILLIVNSIRGVAPPVGESMLAYLTVGFLPFFAVIYISRQTMIAMANNIPLLFIPIVKPLDLLLGHVFLELINTALVYILMILGVAILGGIDMMPRHVLDAFLSFGAATLLGVGLAILNGAIALMYRQWVTGYMLIVIVLYATSGVLTPVENLPASVVHILAINPIFDAVEWGRATFYDNYGVGLYSKTYVVLFGLFSLAIGLLVERALRGRILLTVR